MESVTVSATDLSDAAALAAVAAQTFPLACPPSVTPEAIAAFVSNRLSADNFCAWLRDPRSAVLAVRTLDRIVGYALLIRDSTDDAAVELSKFYLLNEFHGGDAAGALMAAVVSTCIDWAAERIRLGVNQKNVRAQRFYAKQGFTIEGTRTFAIGDRLEQDFIMERTLHSRHPPECPTLAR